jgi:chorismate dehydratase
MLQSGEVDISPSSSFEYLLNSRKYLLLPDVSISSGGPVQSVLLFSPCSPEKLAGRTIGMTGESATSINLLRVLLREYYALPQVLDSVPSGAAEDLITARQPVLLIGDRAMKQARQLPAGMQIYDLGELWLNHTGLPFVFALWIIRRAAAHDKADQLRLLHQQLKKSLTMALQHLPQLATKTLLHHELNLPPDELIHYWRTINYQLTPQHLEGLKKFAQLCHKYQLIAQEPQIEFFR